MGNSVLSLVRDVAVGKKVVDIGEQEGCNLFDTKSIYSQHYLVI